MVRFHAGDFRYRGFWKGRTMDEMEILAKMEKLRKELATLAKQLPNQDKEYNGIRALHDDIYRLRGRFMQIASSQRWQNMGDNENGGKAN